MGSPKAHSPLNIVVDNSLSTPQFPPPPGWTTETHVVDPLAFQVHTAPTASLDVLDEAPALLTFPDIGQGESAFCTFFQHARRTRTCLQLDNASCHFHTYFPGHAIDSSNLHKSDDVSMSALVRAVISLIDRFSIRRVVGFGIGLGAVVLLRAAAAIPPKFCGLVLVSPMIAPSSMPERVSTSIDGFFSNQFSLGLTRRIKDQFLSRWLSDAIKAENFGVVNAVEEDLDRRNPNNVLRILAEDTGRGDASQIISQITARVLLVTGKESSLHFHVADYINEFNAQNSSWLDVPDVGSLVHDEAADRVAKPLALFLQGIPGFI